MGLFNKKKENSFDFNKAFKQNLKYISSKKIDIKDINSQFIKTNNNFYLTVGEIDCPTGKIVISDPLAYLSSGKFCPTLEKKVKPGKYKVEVSIFRNKYVGIRMCTARLKINNNDAIKYELANPTKDTALKAKDGIVSGFPVDAGLISFCDEQVGIEYRTFLDKWYKENPKGNHYDDYFAKFFKESELKLPQYQREGGDFIEWKNPLTNNKLVMIASGLGDGFYQPFIGYDNNNEICEIIVPMLNPNLFKE